MGKILPVLLVVFWCQFSLAQVEVRQFTNKNGQQIKASLLDVTSDMKNMKIRREDGVEFETEIVALSLDDQQYIKDWLKNRPSKTDFRLDVSLSKKLIKSNSHPYSSSYTLHQDEYGYEIKITNLSRETLGNPTVSYQVIRQEGVRVMQADDGDWTYTDYSDDDKDEFVLAETVDVNESLAFNREVTIITKPMTIERVVYDSSAMYQDELFGVIVKVANEKGDPVGEYRSTGKDLESIKWEDAFDFKPDKSSDGPSRVRPRPRDMDDGPASYSMQKGDSIDGPLYLEDMPISLTAKVDPGSASEGVIVSVGGGAKGVAIYLKDKNIYAVQSIEGNHRIVEVRQPLGSFKVGLNLTDRELQLLIDDKIEARRDSGGLFKGSSKNGIEVGQDSDSPVGDYKAPFPFAGGIGDVTVLIGI